jgi:hypothetical protein
MTDRGYIFMPILRAFVSSTCLGALVLGCNKGPPPDEAKPAAVYTQSARTPARASNGPAVLRLVGGDAVAIYRGRCATCHGISGKGNGLSAIALNPKPRSFGDPTWQGSVTDAEIKKVIVEGGSAIGKSPLMTANPDLRGQTAILDGLVRIIRGLK